MKDNILRVHIKYKNGRINELAVLWDDGSGNQRATFVNDRPVSGYKYLSHNEEITDSLIKGVAEYGMALPEEKLREYFSK